MGPNSLLHGTLGRRRRCSTCPKDGGSSPTLPGSRRFFRAPPTSWVWYAPALYGVRKERGRVASASEVSDRLAGHRGDRRRLEHRLVRAARRPARRASGRPRLGLGADGLDSTWLRRTVG